jgi:hypothetical protein
LFYQLGMCSGATHQKNIHVCTHPKNSNSNIFKSLPSGSILNRQKNPFLDYQALRGDNVTCVEYSIPSSLQFLPSPKCLTAQFYVKKESRPNWGG